MRDGGRGGYRHTWTCSRTYRTTPHRFPGSQPSPPTPPSNHPRQQHPTSHRTSSRQHQTPPTKMTKIRPQSRRCCTKWSSKGWRSSSKKRIRRKAHKLQQGGTPRRRKGRKQLKMRKNNCSRKIKKISRHRTKMGTKALGKGQISWSTLHCSRDRILTPPRTKVLTSATQILPLHQADRAARTVFSLPNPSAGWSPQSWTRTPASGFT